MPYPMYVDLHNTSHKSEGIAPATAKRIDELTKYRKSLTTQVSRIERDIQDLDNELEALKSLRIPSEPTGAGTLYVTFTKRFAGVQPYTFAAVRAENNRDRWSVTGRAGLTAVTWNKLLEFIQHDEKDAQWALDSVTVLKPKRRSLTGKDWGEA